MFSDIEIRNPSTRELRATTTLRAKGNPALTSTEKCLRLLFYSIYTREVPEACSIDAGW